MLRGRLLFAHQALHRCLSVRLVRHFSTIVDGSYCDCLFDVIFLFECDFGFAFRAEEGGERLCEQGLLLLSSLIATHMSVFSNDVPDVLTFDFHYNAVFIGDFKINRQA